MKKYNYSDTERQFNRVLKHQSEELSTIITPDLSSIETRIEESEEMLRSLGYSLELANVKYDGCRNDEMKRIVVPSWEHLSADAESADNIDIDLESLFTDEELRCNEQAIRKLNEEYNVLNRLDKYDIAICAAAGLLGASIDILLVGIPGTSSDGFAAGPVSNYIRKSFDKRFPAEEMEKLANSKVSKVPYDAQDNRNTTEYVEGLSSYYHRLLSLGHDPLLGLTVGVLDIMTGRMTTIDKAGKTVSQVMDNYLGRKECSVFAAIAKQIMHFKSDITTSMGLPAPLMGLFNLLQFGSIGEEEQTIAEIVQGMYYEGFDFIHFCTLSIPVMIVEVAIRLGYAMKRIKQGRTVKESLPFSLNREKHPKLATMLFIGHSAATAVNAGKVYFTQNPMAISYPQWMAFAQYSYGQLKWVLINKPEARDAYVSEKINEQMVEVYDSIDLALEELKSEHIFVFE